MQYCQTHVISLLNLGQQIDIIRATPYPIMSSAFYSLTLIRFTRVFFFIFMFKCPDIRNPRSNLAPLWYSILRWIPVCCHGYHVKLSLFIRILRQYWLVDRLLFSTFGIVKWYTVKIGRLISVKLSVLLGIGVLLGFIVE